MVVTSLRTIVGIADPESCLQSANPAITQSLVSESAGASLSKVERRALIWLH